MYRRRSDLEYVLKTPEGRFLTDGLIELSPADVEEVCDVCEEPDHLTEDHANEELNRRSARDVRNHPNTRST